jgi:hypothetical protein
MLVDARLNAAKGIVAENLAEKLDLLLSAHHHSNGDEWADEAKAALAAWRGLTQLAL